MISCEKLATSLCTVGEEFILDLGKALDEAKYALSAEEYENLKAVIGGVIDTLDVDLLWPLHTRYPDLEPSHLKGWQHE